MNLPLDSSPCFNMKINEFHKKTFSNLVFGDEFDLTITIGMYNDLFHFLETKFQSKEIKIMLQYEFPFEIQYNMSSVHKGLVLNFNLQVESIVIHLSHELHDITKSLENLKL